MPRRFRGFLPLGIALFASSADETAAGLAEWATDYSKGAKTFLNIPICPCVNANSYCSCDPSADNWVWDYQSGVASDVKSWLEVNFSTQAAEILAARSNGGLQATFATTPVVPITVWTCGETPYNDYGAIIAEAKQWLLDNEGIDVEGSYDFSCVFIPPHLPSNPPKDTDSLCPGGTTGAAGAAGQGAPHSCWVYLVQDEGRPYSERMGATGGVWLHELGHGFGSQHGTLGGGEPGDYATLMDSGDALYIGWHALGKLIFGWLEPDRFIQLARPGRTDCPVREGTCSSEGGTFTITAHDADGTLPAGAKAGVMIYGPKNALAENYYIIEYDATSNNRLDYSRGATIYFGKVRPQSGNTHMYGDTAIIDSYPLTPLVQYQKSMTTLPVGETLVLDLEEVGAAITVMEKSADTLTVKVGFEDLGSRSYTVPDFSVSCGGAAEVTIPQTSGSSTLVKVEGITDPTTLAVKVTGSGTIRSQFYVFHEYPVAFMKHGASPATGAAAKGTVVLPSDSSETWASMEVEAVLTYKFTDFPDYVFQDFVSEAYILIVTPAEESLWLPCALQDKDCHCHGKARRYGVKHGEKTMTASKTVDVDGVVQCAAGTFDHWDQAGACECLTAASGSASAPSAKVTVEATCIAGGAADLLADYGEHNPPNNLGSASVPYCGRNRYLSGGACQACASGKVASPGFGVSECTSCDSDGEKPWYAYNPASGRCTCTKNDEYCTCIDNLPPPTYFELSGVTFCHHGTCTQTSSSGSATIVQPDFLEGTPDECMADCAQRPTCVGFTHSESWGRCWFRDDMSTTLKESSECDGFIGTDYFNSRNTGNVTCLTQEILTPQEACNHTITAETDIPDPDGDPSDPGGGPSNPGGGPSDPDDPSNPQGTTANGAAGLAVTLAMLALCSVGPVLFQI